MRRTVRGAEFERCRPALNGRMLAADSDGFRDARPMADASTVARVGLQVRGSGGVGGDFGAMWCAPEHASQRNVGNDTRAIWAALRPCYIWCPVRLVRLHESAGS